MTAGVPGAIPPVTDTAPHWVKKPELESVFLRDDRQPNNDTTSVPWRSVCHLVVGRQNGSRSFGTGWFAGPKMVITAAHCVLDHRPRAGWASSITVIPGRNGNYFPFQSQDVASVYIDPRWEREQDHRYDFAVLIMPDRQLGTAVSWFGFAALTDSYLSKPLLINCAGYPDDKPRGTQWSDGGRIERSDENFLYYYIDTEVGQSGSPIFFYGHNQERIVLAIHTTGEADNNHGTRITREIYEKLLAFRDIIALDRGPGIKDLAGSLRNGYSTTGSPGTGLGAIIRQSDIFDIYTQPGKGTAVFSRVRPTQCSAPGSRWELEIGAVCKAAPGEDVSGDAWKARYQPNGGVIVIVDGLGHGAAAAEAAQKAVRTFDASSHISPASMVSAMNAALRSTRGAAVAVARIDFTAGTIAFAGIGNVSGTLIDGEVTRKTVSHNGIVGHVVRSIQEFVYPCSRNTLVVLHSDGLATNWHLQAYPGLTEKHPGVVAAILYRDFTRGRDDVTVVVARCPQNA